MKKDLFNPFPWYKHMQKSDPVYYDPTFTSIFGSQGAWHVFSYQAVQEILKNHQIFSSEFMPKIEENPYSRAMSVTDPPRHKQLKSLVTKVFTPKSIADLEGKIQHITDDLLAESMEDGETEYIRDFATLLPIQVISEMLGVPFADREQFKKWSVDFLQDPSASEEGAASYYQTQKEMMGYFSELIEMRSQKQENDLISQLLLAEVDGERLSKDDLIGFCILLLVAGNETTTNLLGSAVLTFIEHAEIQEYLRKNLHDIPKAIEEVLRYRSPVQSTYRIAKEETKVQGQLIKRGELIVVWLGAANHDESIFPQSEQFHIHRNNQSQIAFGHGIHYCLGAPLARLEAKIALESILKRYENINLKESAKLSIRNSHLVYALENLPITFTKQ